MLKHLYKLHNIVFVRSYIDHVDAVLLQHALHSCCTLVVVLGPEAAHSTRRGVEPSSASRLRVLNLDDADVREVPVALVVDLYGHDVVLRRCYLEGIIELRHVALGIYKVGE